MSYMSHHPAKPVESAQPRQKCNGRSCYPNRHVADFKAAEAESQTGQPLKTFKCKQCGMWHLKLA